MVVILFAVGEGAWKVSQKAVVARTERDIAERSLEELRMRTEELQVSLVRLKSDQGIEEEVRQKYTVARKGEEVVVVIDEQAKKSENGGVYTGGGFWKRFGSFFGF